MQYCLRTKTFHWPCYTSGLQNSEPGQWDPLEENQGCLPGDRRQVKPQVWRRLRIHRLSCSPVTGKPGEVTTCMHSRQWTCVYLLTSWELSMCRPCSQPAGGKHISEVEYREGKGRVCKQNVHAIWHGANTMEKIKPAKEWGSVQGGSRRGSSELRGSHLGSRWRKGRVGTPQPPELFMLRVYWTTDGRWQSCLLWIGLLDTQRFGYKVD